MKKLAQTDIVVEPGPELLSPLIAYGDMLTDKYAQTVG